MKDIKILEMHCDDSVRMFDAFGDNCFDIHDVKRIRNITKALKWYINSDKKKKNYR